MPSPKLNSTNFISQGVLTETEQKFGNPRQYYSYYGSVLESEPLFARWLEAQIGQSLLVLHATTLGNIAHLPLLTRDIDQALRRIAMLSYYLGGRRFTKEMNQGLEAAINNPKATEADEGGLIGEVEEKDFLDPEPEED